MYCKSISMTKNNLCMNPTMNAPKCKGRVYEQSLGKYFELTESGRLTYPSAARTTSVSRTTAAVRPRSSLRHSPGRRASTSMMPLRWRVPSHARNALILRKASGRTSCCTWIIRHPASCTSTSVFRWVRPSARHRRLTARHWVWPSTRTAAHLSA